jgi:hypothetical protein
VTPSPPPVVGGLLVASDLQLFQLSAPDPFRSQSHLSCIAENVAAMRSLPLEFWDVNDGTQLTSLLHPFLLRSPHYLLVRLAYFDVPV